MPVEDVLPATGVPIKLHAVPQDIDAVYQVFLFLVAVVKVLADTQQSLHQETTLHEVAAVIFLAKGLHLARRPVDPVGPHAVKAVGTLQEVHDARQALNTLFTGDETAFHGHDKSCDAKSAASRGHHVLVVFGILAVEVDALTGQARSGLCTVPHVVKVYALDIVEHGLVVGKRFGTLCLLVSGNWIGCLALAGRKRCQEGE